MAVRQLTPEEEAKPYAKYYHRPVTPPDADLIAQIKPDAPIDPALALPPERISDLLDPGYHEVETGWCIMPNGTGYLAVHNRMPGVTVEMLDWWFWWHSMASMRYGLWYPPGHYGISISKKSRAKLSRPERAGQGEDLRPHRPRGRGHRYGRRGHLHQLLRPRGDGLRHEPLPRARTSRPSTAASASTSRRAPSRATSGRPPSCATSSARSRRRRRVPLALLDGLQAHRRQAGAAPSRRASRCRPRCRYGLADHNVKEYCNLKSLLPEIWAEFKDADPAL